MLQCYKLTRCQDHNKTTFVMLKTQITYYITDHVNLTTKQNGNNFLPPYQFLHNE